ncbi:mannose-1-phosphate guanylyltransferase/mannose-6-phosphate isomerase [Piscinibacterium candidicorallinum]|uniref:mannose-1-phosphate guanylyltransferase n=1 Tax=Piscinibacterium candidicorallinum TaxID=1793872 RepID=A0ABV7H5G8_9BURK
MQIQPVIMAGGSGTRLWPLSRAAYPKQFLAINGPQTLFQQAAVRVASLASDTQIVLEPLVVTNEEHRFMVLDQLREIGMAPMAVLLEPAGKNTAPALTLAALQAAAAGADPVLVVTPSDQTVTNAPAYVAALREAAQAAQAGGVVILGVVPTRPETGFGYIDASATGMVREVKAFREKPDAATAEKYLAAGHYFWNSGMFVLKASVWLDALRKLRADIATATEAAWAKRGATDQAFIRPDKSLWTEIPSESIDYAVMEHTATAGIPVRMVPLDAGWSDLGAWDAVWDSATRDGAGNAVQGDVLLQDSRGTLVHATDRMVAAVGVENLVIVETPDAVLVADKSASQGVKHIVASLAKSGRSEGNLHRRVHRPWGWYDSIDQGARFQVKRIQVKPGASLSLQMHHHRAEHWIVVSGTAEVTVGDKKIMLTENQSTYIPLGEVHRLANPGKLPLEIIEVQSGSYLGEDDIVRFEDHYGRK